MITLRFKHNENVIVITKTFSIHNQIRKKSAKKLLDV
jgi:hypothetical protein